MHYQVSQEFIEYCQDALQGKSLGNRRTNTNGSYKQQLFGLIAENVVRQILGYELNDASGGFDNGWDLLYNYKKIDVKTSIYNEPPQSYHRYDVPIMQLQDKYKSQGYIFCNYNQDENIVSISGYISKEDFIQKSSVINKGDFVQEGNGKSFVARYKSYFVRPEDLEPFIANEVI